MQTNLTKKSELPFFRDEFVSSFNKIFDVLMKDSFPNFSDQFGIDYFERGSFPKVDIIDNLNDVVIYAEIPGLNKEEIDITVKNGVLTISGHATEKTNLKETGNSKFILKELKHSSFKRAFALGDNLDVKSITADFKNGILAIGIQKLQKKEHEQFTQIKIN